MTYHTEALALIVKPINEPIFSEHSTEQAIIAMMKRGYYVFRA